MLSAWRGWMKTPAGDGFLLVQMGNERPEPVWTPRWEEVGLLQAGERGRGGSLTRCRLRSDSGRSRSAAGDEAAESRDRGAGRGLGGGAYLADGGQFGQQHLEDGRRQRLLQHLQQLLRLAAHGDGVGQVVHAALVVSWGRKRAAVRAPPGGGEASARGPYPEPAAPPPAGSPPGRTSAPPPRPSGPAAADTRAQRHAGSV